MAIPGQKSITPAELLDSSGRVLTAKMPLLVSRSDMRAANAITAAPAGAAAEPGGWDTKTTGTYRWRVHPVLYGTVTGAPFAIFIETPAANVIGKTNASGTTATLIAAATELARWTKSGGSAKTFDSGKVATLVVQDITYDADTRGTAGNSITIEYTGGATAGAEVVSVVGTAISVQIENGVSTANQIKTAVDNFSAAAALVDVTVSGVGGNAQNTAAATPLATGADPEVTVATNSIAIPTHGYTTGWAMTLSSTGTPPAGLAAGTVYFVIEDGANAVKLASSYELAVAGTAIDLTDQGSNGAVNTLTPKEIVTGDRPPDLEYAVDLSLTAGDWVGVTDTNNNLLVKTDVGGTSVVMRLITWLERTA